MSVQSNSQGSSGYLDIGGSENCVAPLVSL